MKLKALAISLTLLLAACSTTGPVTSLPASLPVLEPPAQVGNFQERMQNFLQEKQLRPNQ